MAGGVLAVLAVAAATTGIGPAQAQLSSFGVTALPLFPANVTVGAQNQVAGLAISNNSVGTFATQSAVVSSIRLNPSCNSTGTLPCSAAEPRPFPALPILAVDSPGVGRAGTACAGTAFSVSVPDATGTVTFTPSAPVVLGPASTGGPGASCVIDLTFDVQQRPLDGAVVANLAVQASTPPPGQPGTITGSTGIGTSAAIAVAPAPTTLVTHASSSVVPEGASFAATAVVTGVLAGPPLTGNVVFRLYRSTSAFLDCSAGQLFSTYPPVPILVDPASGVPRATATSPSTAPPAGNYVFVASYDENNTDVSYGASTTACADPAARVTVNPVLPSIFVDIAANPATVPEPGATVTFAVQVVNTGARDVTLISLSGDVYGNLNGRGTCATAAPGSGPPAPPLLTANGGTYACSFSAEVSGNAGQRHINVVTAIGTDSSGNSAIDFDDAIVTVTGVPPAVSVFMVASPLTLPAPGGTFTYVVSIRNDSAIEPVTVTNLSDGVFGDVATRPGSTCGALIGSTLAPGATSSTCAFTGEFTGQAGASLTNVITVVVIDNDGDTASSSDDATVSLTSPGGIHRQGNDFDGNATTDIAVFRPASGSWFLRTAAPSVVAWGQEGDIPVPGDYDGNGTVDIAVFRPSNNAWYIRTPTPQFVLWGEAGDIPVPADYDGNGTTDIAIFRPSTGTWYLRTASPSAVVWGQAGDIPVPGDYDGNGTVDIAVFRPSNNAWYLRTTTPQFVLWGEAGDIPVPGDYDNNGTTDIAIFRPATGTWYLRTGSPSAVVWGQAGDVPAPGDYDGNGSTDIAVFRPANSSWYIRTPTPQFVAWGQTGDKALSLPDAIRRFFSP